MARSYNNYSSGAFLNGFTATTVFGEQRLATVTPTIQLKFPYSTLNTNYATSSVASGGTLSFSQGVVVLNTTTASGSTASFTSNNALHYSAGFGSVVMFAAAFSSNIPQSNLTQLIGIGTFPSNGLFFGALTGSSFGILTITSGTNTFVQQSSWNVDPLNGSGQSQLTLTPSQYNIYKIQFQWLGFGCTNFYVQPFQNTRSQELILVHQIQYTNTATSVILNNPTLPLVAFAKNQGSSSTTSNQMSIAWMMGGIEGALNSAGDTRNAVFSPGTGISYSASISPAQTPVMGIETATTFPSLGTTSQVRVFLDSVTLTGPVNTGSTVFFSLILNPTSFSSPPTYGKVNSSTSVVSFFTAGTGTVSGGTLLASFVAEPSLVATIPGAQFTVNVQNYNIRLDPGAQLVLAASSSASVTTVGVFGMSWHESF